jgi:hypothetical protein
MRTLHNVAYEKVCCSEYLCQMRNNKVFTESITNRPSFGWGQIELIQYSYIYILTVIIHQKYTYYTKPVEYLLSKNSPCVQSSKTSPNKREAAE